MHVERGKGKPGRTGFPLAIVGAGVMLAALGMVFLVVPREATMGDVQRIFYFHVAFAWVGFLAFLVTGVSGALYLVWRAQGLDWLGSSSAEVGLVFISAALLAGSLWARPTWGTYWTWEPRLTISALQWLVYVAYLMLRGAVDDSERRARFGAVYGIIASATVPLSWFAIRWWRTIHPELLVAGRGMALAPRMGWALLAAVVASTLLYANLLLARVRLESAQDQLESLRGRLRVLGGAPREGDATEECACPHTW